MDITLKNLFIFTFGCTGSFLLCSGFLGKQRLLFVAACRFLIVVVSLVVEVGLSICGLQSSRVLCTLVVMAHRV